MSMSTTHSLPTWNVHVIEFARSKDQLVAGLVHDAYDEGRVDVPFSFVLARHGSHVALIDTGFMKEGSGQAMSEKFGVPFWISPLRMLGELGIAPDAVTDIVLSHAHFDHMGSIHQFPRARIHIQKRELLSWIEALAMPRQFGYLTDIINPDDLRNAFDASLEHRLNLVDGDLDNLLPGLHLRLGEGHTVGQQFVVLETERGRLVISGDCVYSQRNICGHNHDGVYVPLANATGSVWDQLRTFDRINKEIEGDLSRLVILHDMQRWVHLPVEMEVDGFRIARAS
ncbi:N-acyl homoserine lactonase family protein [Aureimonas altamirensis]|uniref:N-acyl homoserine lactonase family protein n=1 Tax=Aureimonas altamirensis TaxID=370622 RepID=UPI001E63E760|nr:N-acyl homoserine lactonase family protein [Aureimonas altamirensis]UHD43779.1 N-acyl homoserine lactonase family protein [Aureimonas altamirensis]